MIAIEVESLVVRYRGRVAPAVDDVSFRVPRGRTVGIVGESGCGKTTLAQALVGLVKPSAGHIRYHGEALTARSRWRRGPPAPAQIIFQDPQSSLNPRRRVWQIIAEPLAIAGTAVSAQRERAQILAAEVGLGAEHLERFPHEFSGGQRQRIAIARALATDSAILILDEPTSALDVSVQAQVLNLLLRLQRERQMTCVFISHNISVIRHMSDEVVVMHAGRVVEAGLAADVLDRPQHCYTRSLIAAVPRLVSA